MLNLLQSSGAVLIEALFENFVISEIIKMQHHAGQKPSVYYWRDHNGIEIDCIVEDVAGQISKLSLQRFPVTDEKFM